MGALRCVSRSGLRLFVTSEDAFPALERWYTHNGDATFSKVEPASEIFLDGGGSIFIDEATAAFSVDDVPFKIFIRHIPYFKSYLEGLAPNDIGGCIKFAGFRTVYVFTEKTCRGLVEKLGELWVTKEAEANALNDKAATIMAQAGVVYAGKCICQSGQMYVNCCGRKQVL